MTRDEIIDATRAFVRSEILHDPAAELAPSEPLLSGGIITSFDLVSLTVFLEQRFGVKVPDARVSRDFLDTLEQIATLVTSLSGAPSDATEQPEPSTDRVSRWLLPSFKRWPLVVLGVIGLSVALLDRLVGALLEDPVVLARLEGPEHRRMNYCYQSYERALARHELALTPRAQDEVRIVFQGDSGTFGGYLEPEEACPAVLGRLLAEKEPRARVYNVSYFGQTFVKDAEMLEADLPYKPDLIIVSFCSIHLHREFQQSWWLVPPTTIVYNRSLFTRFLLNVPSDECRRFQDLAGVLALSEKTNDMGYLHGFERYSAIVRNQLLLRNYVSSSITPSSLEPVTRARSRWLDGKTGRYLHGKTTNDVLVDWPYSFDERSLALLEAIIDRARAGGAEVVLFWEPEPTVKGSPPSRIPWNKDGWETIERMVQGVVDRKNVPLVNCRDILDQEEFLDSERHWTIKGNAKIGQVLAERLAPLVAKLAARPH
jgi:acyl carrier protein